MKKLLIGLVLTVVLIFGGLKIAETVVMGGTDYYVQITDDGTKTIEQDDSGNSMTKYKYQLTGYDKEGNAKVLDFSAFKDRPLKRDAYLKLTWNQKKGVTSYEEVQKNDLPQKAEKKLGQ